MMALSQASATRTRGWSSALESGRAGAQPDVLRRYDPNPGDYSISASPLQAFLTGPRAAGLDADALLAANGLPPEIASNPRARLRVDQWARILQNVIVSMDDEAMGLLPRPMPAGTFLMICRAFIHCRTVGEAMERYVAFYNLLRSGITYRLERERRTVRFSVQANNPSDLKHSVLADFILVGFHRLFSWLGAELIHLDSVWIATPPPAYASEYREGFFHTPVQFNQPRHSISFSDSYLDLPIVQAERDLERYLARFNTALFLPTPSTGKLSRSLRTYMLGEKERTGVMPELGDAAAHFGMHVRGLCRRLKDEGMSFQEIKSRVRRDIAIYYLANTSDSMERIAERAGFSETSAFIRAFRGWTNMTPLAYRKALTA